MDEHLSFIPIKYRSAVRLSAFSFVAAYNGQWEHGDWEHFLAELVATTGLQTLESDPESRDSIGMYLEKLRTLYQQEGEEAFAKRVGEARQTNFQMENVPDWLLTVGSSVWGSVKSLLAWLHHLWAAELKAESLPRSIPLAMRGLLGTLFPVIKLKYVFVLLGAVVVGGWGANALRYREVVSALEDRRFESALKAASALESSFSSRFHAYNPLESIWLKPAFRRLVDEQVSFAAYEVGETVRLSKRTALFTELPDLPLLDLTLEEHQDELRWNDRPTAASDLMEQEPDLAIFSGDGALLTAILEVWAWRALQKRPHPRFGTIPVAVDLDDFVGDARQLANHVVGTIRSAARAYGFEIPESVVRHRVAEGGFLFVVSHLEASGDPLRTAAAVRSLVSDPAWRGNRWRVSYRIDFASRALRPSLSPLTEVWAAPFREADVGRVIRTAFPHAPDSVIVELRRAPRLTRALRNPLVMAMAIKRARRIRTVPRRLGSFYRAVAMDALASSQTEITDGEALPPQAQEVLLGHVAQNMGPRRETLSRSETEEALTKALGRSKEQSISGAIRAARVLEGLLRTYMLVKNASVSSWSSGYEVRFLLPSFRDYFHAAAVARRLPAAEREGRAEKELAAFLDDPANAEAASFLVGLVEDASVIFDFLLARARRARDDGFPKAARRYLRLAARLFPSATAVDEGTVVELTDALVVETRGDAFASDRKRILEVLSYIRSPAVLQALQEALRDSNPHIRRSAVIGLEQLRGPEAVGPLVAAFRDSDSSVQARASAALTLAPPELAVPALEALLDENDHALRARVVSTLGQVGGRESARVLERALTDENPLVRRFAARALGQLARPETHGALTSALQDADTAVRAEAARALGSLKTPSVVPALVATLDDPSLRVKHATAEALGEIGTHEAVEALEQAMKGASVVDQRTLIGALGRAGGSTARQILQRVLAQGEPVVQSAAIQALGQMSGPRALEVLKEALKGMDPSVRHEAAATLRSLRDHRAGPTLVSLLDDPDPLIRAEALRGLGELHDETAKEFVAQSAADANAEVRQAAAEALGRIGDETTDGVLAKLVADEVAKVRASALEAYAVRTKSSRKTIFIRALDDPDSGVRYSATAALERSPSPAAVSALIAHSVDPDPFARREIVRVLGHVAGKQAVPVLLERLVEADPSIRAEAARSLRRIGPEALPSLEALLASRPASGPVSEELYDLSVILDAKINRNDAAQLALVAEGYTKHRQWRRALTLLRAALGLADGPGRQAKFLASIGQALEALGDHKAALESYRRSLKLAPYNKRAQEALQAIEMSRRPVQ